MEAACTNLVQNEDGQYEDPISLAEIPPDRVVHLPMRNLLFCYDALELLRFIRVEQDARRQPSLPDNRILLLPAGIEEVRRVARLSFTQLYQVVGPRGQFPAFDLEQEALNYIDARPRKELTYYSFADTNDDPLLEDLMYPDGFEATPADQIPGPYFNQAAMDEREDRNRRQEEGDRALREQEQVQEQEGEGEALLPPAPVGYFRDGGQIVAFADRDAWAMRRGVAREGEVEIGTTLAYEKRPGEWRCGTKQSIYRNRREGSRFGTNIDYYCNGEEIDQLQRLGRNINDPRAWNLGERIDVQGETVLLEGERGYPTCSNNGGMNLDDPCRPDLIEEIAAIKPRRYLDLMQGQGEGIPEFEYRFDRASRKMRCRNLDDPDGEEYDCTDSIRDTFAWNSVAEDPDVIYRRLTLRGPIECATKEQWHTARGRGEPIPWSVCEEEQLVYLRQLPGDRGEFFRDLEDGRYADEDEDEADEQE